MPQGCLSRIQNPMHAAIRHIIQNVCLGFMISCVCLFSGWVSFVVGLVFTCHVRVQNRMHAAIRHIYQNVDRHMKRDLSTKEKYLQKKRTKETNESKTRHIWSTTYTRTHTLSLKHTQKKTHTHTHTHTHTRTHAHTHTRTHTHVLDLHKAMHVVVCHICQKIQRLLYISLDHF